ncbi:30S ribosomal protein S13 [candidate division KSB1 bacterium]
MARISGVDIPKEKRILIALTYIYGIGKSSSKKILEKANIDPNTRVRELKDEDIAKIRTLIDGEHTVEGSLRTQVTMNIKRLMEIGSYRGLRHRRGLPLRGQRTKTNARTRKGKKKLVGARRKKV